MKPVLTSKVQARSLVDVVVERLEAAIIGGELAPGTRLSEQSLAKSLGVSRGPLREAIRRLEGRSLIERTPNIGVRVAALSSDDLEELLYVREALEGMACALAAENISKPELDALQKLLEKHESQKDLKSGKGYYQESRDFDFHFRIARASRNDRLISMICGDLYDLLRIYRYKSSTMKGRAAQAMIEHRRIVEALKTGDPALSEQRMREHIRSARAHATLALKAAQEKNNGGAPAREAAGEPPAEAPQEDRIV